MNILERQAKEIELAKEKELKTKRFFELISVFRDYNITEDIFEVLSVAQMRVLALVGKIKDASTLNRNDLIANLLLFKDGKLVPFETSSKGAPKKSISNFEGVIEVIKSYAIKFNKANSIDYIAKERTLEKEKNESKDKFKSMDSLADSNPIADFGTSDEQAIKDLGTENIGKGVLEILPEGYGFLRGSSYVGTRRDVYVPDSAIKKMRLRHGDFVVGKAVTNSDSSDYLMYIHSINGLSFDSEFKRQNFDDLTPMYPNEKIKLEIEDENDSTTRSIELMCPIGKGQRALIVSPPKAGKTTIIKKLAKSIMTNHEEIKLFILLIDERPEEVTDIRSTVDAEVIDSTFDMSYERHIRVTELLLERAKRLVETGRDVVILLDSITRLSMAYNNVMTPSGRSMSGGLDIQALQQPKKFFGAARNLKEGGSLTIIATALVETGSKMDDIIFEEFKGTGNMELNLDRQLAERRIYPSINLMKSGTRMDQLIQTEEELSVQHKVRRMIASKNSIEGSIAFLDMLEKTKTNAEFIEKFPEWVKLSTNNTI